MSCFLQSPNERMQCPEIYPFPSRKAPGEIEPLPLAEGRRFPLKKWFRSESHWMISIHLDPVAWWALQWESPQPCSGAGAGRSHQCDWELARLPTGRASEHRHRRKSTEQLLSISLICFPALELKKLFPAQATFPLSFTWLALCVCIKSINLLDFCINPYSLILFFSVTATVTRKRR